MSDETTPLIFGDAAVAEFDRSPRRKWFGRKRKSRPPLTHCENCGAALTGPYCAQCGQPAIDYHRSFGSLLADAADAFFNFDARFLTIVWAAPLQAMAPDERVRRRETRPSRPSFARLPHRERPFLPRHQFSLEGRAFGKWPKPQAFRILARGSSPTPIPLLAHTPAPAFSLGLSARPSPTPSVPEEDDTPIVQFDGDGKRIIRLPPSGWRNEPKEKSGRPAIGAISSSRR